MFEKAGKYLNSVRGWVWIVSTVGPTAAAFVAGLLEGMPWSHRTLLVTATLAAGAVLAYHILVAYERVSSWWGTRKQGEQVARKLEALIAVGHTHLKINDLARMWAGQQATEYDWNICLRRLKQAAEQGIIQAKVGARTVPPTKDSRAELRDCVTFFRERKWLALPSIPSTPPQSPPKAPQGQQHLQAQSSPFVRRVRANWVTDWRR